MTVCLTCDQQVNAAYYRQILKKLTAYFEANPCTDCGETDLVLLDFVNSDKIWKAIEQQERWTVLNGMIQRSESICVSCIRRRIAAKVGLWGLTSG